MNNAMWAVPQEVKVSDSKLQIQRGFYVSRKLCCISVRLYDSGLV